MLAKNNLYDLLVPRSSSAADVSFHWWHTYLPPPPPPPTSLQYTEVPTENRAVLLNRALFSCIAALVRHHRTGGRAASTENAQHVTIFTQNTTFFCQPVLKITQNSITRRCLLHKLRFTSDILCFNFLIIICACLVLSENMVCLLAPWKTGDNNMLHQIHLPRQRIAAHSACSHSSTQAKCCMPVSLFAIVSGLKSLKI